MAQATTLPAILTNTDPQLFIPSNPDRDFDVLTACCSAVWDTASQIRFIQLLRSVSDWQRVLNAAEHHGLISLLFEQVTGCFDAIPPDQLNQLRFRYQENSRRALWFSHELSRVVQHLRCKGIQAIAHKGPALSLALYGDVTQRQYRDLDLLVRPEDVKRARAALAELKYTCDIDLPARQERAYLESGYEYVFDSPAGKNVLEVQWRVVPRFYAVDFDIDRLFERSIEIEDFDWRALAREDLLLVLCVHAAKHVWTQLSWLRDIAQLARSENLDWTLVWKQAGQLGIRRIIALNLVLANRLFKTDFLADGHEQVELLAAEILSIVRHGTPYDTESIAYFKLMMRLRERLRDQLRFASRLAATAGPGEWKAVSLPRPLFPLYRIVRLGRLAKRLASQS